MNASTQQIIDGVVAMAAALEQHGVAAPYRLHLPDSTTAEQREELRGLLPEEITLCDGQSPHHCAYLAWGGDDEPCQ